jgi:hypothetical protein
MARLVAVFDVSSGALTTLGVGGSQGKETGALALFRQPPHHVPPGDVVCADGSYSAYWTLAGLQSQGID